MTAPADFRASGDADGYVQALLASMGPFGAEAHVDWMLRVRPDNRFFPFAPRDGFWDDVRALLRLERV